MSEGSEPLAAAPTAGPLPWPRWSWGATVALVAVPFVAALAGLVGDRWFVAGDWASIDLRVRAVGTAETPLLGPYSTRGWAHPGPALYWVAAPLHRLSGGDPRSLFVTAALVNVAAIVGILHLCRRVAGRGMAAAAALALVLLAHGMGPGRIIDIWNPLVPLFPLAYCCFAAWATAMGHRRAAIPGLVVAALVAQTHVGMVPAVGVVGIWTGVAIVASRRRGPGRAEGPGGRGDGGAEAAVGGDQPSWPVVLAVGGALATATWIPVAVDQLWRSRNLGQVLRYFWRGGGSEPVGLARGGGLVARHLRPDGPWIGGAEPLHFGSVVGSPAVVVAAALLALVGLGLLARRAGHRDVALGTSLAATLVVASVPVAGNVDEPVFDYLVKWLEVVGVLAWFWLGWGSWVLVRSRLAGARPRWAPAALVALTAVATAWSVPAALVVPLPAAREAVVVEDLWRQLRVELPRDRPVRIEHKGDRFGMVAAGLVVHLRRDGVDVVTSDGSKGDKYGPDAVWRPGDPPRGQVLTVAVTYPFSFTDHRRRCRDEGAAVLAEADSLRPQERDRLDTLRAEAFFHPDAVTSEGTAERAALEERAVAATVFVSARTCGGPE